MALTPRPDFDPAASFGEQIQNCLEYSSAFKYVGYRTTNDALLLEMNERAKQHIAAQKPKTPPLDAQNGVAPLDQLRQITQSPPHSRFSEAHSREFAHLAPIDSSSPPKRTGGRLESPSKRLRAPNGRSVGITPVDQVQNLNLGPQLAHVSALRQRERDRRQRSPKRPARRDAGVGSAEVPSDLPKLEFVPNLSISPVPGAFPGMFQPKAPDAEKGSQISSEGPALPSASKSRTLRSPALKSPALKSPALKSPALKSPALKSPALKSPALKSSASQPSALKQPLKSPALPSTSQLAASHPRPFARQHLPSGRSFSQPRALHPRPELSELSQSLGPPKSSPRADLRRAPLRTTGSSAGLSHASTHPSNRIPLSRSSQHIHEASKQPVHARLPASSSTRQFSSAGRRSVSTPNDVPSYARPTQAALRRSLSTKFNENK